MTVLGLDAACVVIDAMFVWFIMCILLPAVATSAGSAIIWWLLILLLEFAMLGCWHVIRCRVFTP
jgi:hypothetical protein